MARLSKERKRANQFRSRAAEILKDAGWLDEGVRAWLEKELGRDIQYIYSENEHAALARVVAASTTFEGWDGYSVPELLKAALRYKFDGDYEDEEILDGLQDKNPAKLRLGDMEYLVGFCRNVAGVPLEYFEPAVEKYNDDDLF
jgi:hypothetical protein